MLGLLGAALAGAGQVAALHSVREGVGFSFLLGRFLLLLFSFFVFFFLLLFGFFWFIFDYYMFIRNYQPATDSAE